MNVHLNNYFMPFSPPLGNNRFDALTTYIYIYIFFFFFPKIH